MNALIKTPSRYLEVLEINLELCSAMWKQPALGLHALHTQLGENWLVQCVPSELTTKQCDKQWTFVVNILTPMYRYNTKLWICTTLC